MFDIIAIFALNTLALYAWNRIGKINRFALLCSMISYAGLLILISDEIGVMSVRAFDYGVLFAFKAMSLPLFLGCSITLVLR